MKGTSGQHLNRKIAKGRELLQSTFAAFSGCLQKSSYFAGSSATGTLARNVFSRSLVKAERNSADTQSKITSQDREVVRGSAQASAPPFVILFDGICNLCNAWVRFVVRHDPNGIFKFAAQQSPDGDAMIRRRLQSPPRLSSIILIAGDALYTESSAMFEIFARLGAPWSWIALLRIIPPWLCDGVYRFVARHRYRWFGRTEVCQMPSSEMRSRFIR